MIEGEADGAGAGRRAHLGICRHEVRINRAWADEQAPGHLCIGMTGRDMAALGQLMLQKGRWEKRQVIAADWVARPDVSGCVADVQPEMRM